MTTSDGAVSSLAPAAAPGRIAVLSMHTSPLAPLGGRETGGMNVYVREVSAELARVGVAVDVFTRRADTVSPEVEALSPGVRLIHVPVGPPERIEKEEMIALTGAFAAGIEAFIAHDAIAGGARYDIVHSHYWLSAVAGREIARAWAAPHVAMFHTLAEVKLLARASEREPEARRVAERELVHEVDRIVAATEHERWLLEQVYAVPRQRVTVIPLGVHRERFRPRDQATARARLGLEADARILLSVGRIEPLKGLDILIESLSEMTERERLLLLIVGGDDRAERELARLRAVADAAGVADLVRFVGAVPHGQVEAYYNAADVVVMPSFYESFGLVAVEAMASGVPVVASRVGGLTSTVADGRSGYLIPWRCPGPFAEKLDLLLGNESLRRALGATASESMQVYEWSSVAARLLDLYATLRARALPGTLRGAAPWAATEDLAPAATGA